MDIRGPILEELLNLHRNIGGWTKQVNFGQQVDIPRCFLKIEISRLIVSSNWTTPIMLTQIGDIATCGGGLVISEVSVNHRYVNSCDDKKDVFSYGNLFQRLFCAGGCPDNGFAVVEDARFALESCNSTLTPRMCTALAETRTTKGVTFPKNFSRNRHIHWRWLAFAFFSKHARAWSSLTSVTLEGATITHSDVDAIAELLDSDNPLEYLICMDSDTVNCSRRMLLRKGTILEMVSIDEWEELPYGFENFTLPADAAKVIPLYQDETSASNETFVLVPGYGVCQVSRSALNTVDDSAHPNPEDFPGITSLSLLFSGCADGVMRLLQMIGGPLTQLKLDFGSYYAPNDFDIGHVLRYCPRLEVLSISGIKIDSNVFLQAYRELDMRIKKLHCSFSNGPVIVYELADGSSPLAKHLESLCWRFKFRAKDEDEVNAACCMLDILISSKSPKYVELDLPVDAFILISRRYGYAITQVNSAPIPLRCRLAFLSIFVTSIDCRAKEVKGNNITCTASRPSQMSLELIFAFAAKREDRQIDIRSTDIDNEDVWYEDDDSSDSQESSYDGNNYSSDSSGLDSDEEDDDNVMVGDALVELSV